MDKGLRTSLLTVCGLLSKHKVEYLIVGGTAVALHGYFRMSVSIAGIPADKPDLDFWYNPSYKNYFNLLDAIEALGEDVSAFKNETSPNPKKSFFKERFQNNFRRLNKFYYVVILYNFAFQSIGFMVDYPDQTEKAMQLFYSTLPEKGRRHYAAVETIKLGYGGLAYISKLLDIDRNTIIQGVKEIEDVTILQQIPPQKQRRPGGGAKKNPKTTRT